MAGLYIHIPFCKQACHYCNFHFSTTQSNRVAVLQAINMELILRANEVDGEIKTIYFGGGSPSLLTQLELEAIFNTIHNHFSISTDVEITFELNPDDANKDYLKMLLNSGINRLSIGIQSFSDVDLKYMNRAHNANESMTCLENTLQCGFQNMTVDFIYGTPTMSDEQWKENLRIAHELGIPHLSCYQLTVEDNTPLKSLIKRNKLAALNEDKFISQFSILMDESVKYGWEQYEISNFAKPGFRSRHNSAYWQGKEYVGIGPSAHSFNGLQRSWNIANNQKYVLGIEKGERNFELEVLSEIDQFNEYVLVNLRLVEGINTTYVENKFPNFSTDFLIKIEEQIDKGLIVNNNSNIVLTQEGKLWCDRISSDLFFVNDLN